MPNSSKSPILPAYLVVGDDALKARTVLERLHTRLKEYGDIDFNTETFDGATVSGEEIVNACRTLPFASDKRQVIVTDSSKLKRDDANVVASYIENPSDTAVLVLVAEKLERNSKLYKATSAIDKTAVINCAVPKSYKMREFVQNMALKTHGLNLSSDAANKLVEYVGTDTVRLNNELKKIALTLGVNSNVSIQDIESLVSRTAEVKPWDFLDAFSSRSLTKALNLYSAMQSISPHKLLGMCVNRLRELMCVNSLRARGYADAGSIAAEFGLAPNASWKVKNYPYYAEQFSGEEIRYALVSSVETERKMKSGANPSTAFMDWVIATLK